MVDKKKARRQIRRALKQIDERRLTQKSIRACRYLCDHPLFKQAQTLMLYIPMPRELDCSLAILTAFEQDKMVTVPRVTDWQGFTMEAARLDGLHAEVDRLAYGLLEPKGTPALPIASLDLIIVPGLGFTRAGARLGRGAGFYDRFLAQETRRAKLCGFAFSEQLLDELPIEAHDIQMDAVITDL